MKAIEIFQSIKPETVLYQCWCGNIQQCIYKLTEVETGYYGERTYRIVLQDSKSSTLQTWVDRSGNEWFTKKEDAIAFEIKRCNDRIAELEGYIRKYKNM